MGACAVTDVLFDFCGVLVDRQVVRTLEGAYPPQAVAEFFAYDDRSGFHYYDDLLDGGLGIEEACRRYAEERGEELAGMFRTYYERIDRGLVRLVPGMEELMGDLARAGVRMWGLTNWAAGSFHHAYRRFPQLEDLLSGVVVSGEEGVAKPDGRLFRIAVERFGLDVGSTLFVDDNSINVEAARAEGLQGRPFIDADHLRRDLRTLGVDVPPAVRSRQGASAAEKPVRADAGTDAGAAAEKPARTGAGMGAAAPVRADAGSAPGGHGGAGAVCGGIGGGMGGAMGDATADEFVRSAHDGASLCETAEEDAGTSLLVPNNGGLSGMWRAVPLGCLVLPSADDPAHAVYRDDFWIARCREYNALQWHLVDWALVRSELVRVAGELAARPCEEPELELAYKTIRERTFLEMWFGYGDPCCEAFPAGDGRFTVGYGQHRICPVANYPLLAADASLMKLVGGAFTPGEALPPDTLLPMFVREG